MTVLKYDFGTSYISRTYYSVHKLTENENHCRQQRERGNRADTRNENIIDKVDNGFFIFGTNKYNFVPTNVITHFYAYTYLCKKS